VTISLFSVSEAELHQWHKGFLHDCPTGKLSYNEFQGIYKQFFPQVSVRQFAMMVVFQLQSHRLKSLFFHCIVLGLLEHIEK